MRASNKGFGLIEFVIVIGIIIVLTLVLIVVNPKEQIDRSRDLSKIMAAETLYSTFIRSEANQTFPLKQAYSATDLTSSEGQSVLDKLVKSMEIQTAFTSKKELSDMHLSYDPQTKVMRLCFKLISKMYQTEYVVEYDQAGNLQANCTPETCYTCLFEEKQYQGTHANGIESSPGAPAAYVPTPTPTPTPAVATGWKRADQTHNCIEYCATQGLSCSDIPLSCPSYSVVLQDMLKSKPLGRGGITVHEIPLVMKRVGRMEAVVQNFVMCHCGRSTLGVVVSEECAQCVCKSMCYLN